MGEWKHWQEDELIPKRIPRDQIKLGTAYLIHARNGGIGIAKLVPEYTWQSPNGPRTNPAHLVYTIRRNKFGRTYLFDEVDWEDDPNFGTAIPLRELTEQPPENQEEWLAWLIELEHTYQEEVLATWTRM